MFWKKHACTHKCRTAILLSVCVRPVTSHVRRVLSGWGVQVCAWLRGNHWSWRWRPEGGMALSPWQQPPQNHSVGCGPEKQEQVWKLRSEAAAGDVVLGEEMWVCMHSCVSLSCKNQVAINVFSCWAKDKSPYYKLCENNFSHKAINGFQKGCFTSKNRTRIQPAFSIKKHLHVDRFL